MTSTKAFITPLSFYYAYTLQNKFNEYAVSSLKILWLKLGFLIVSKVSWLPSTLASFTLYFSYHEVISLLYTIAHLLSLYLECS